MGTTLDRIAQFLTESDIRFTANQEQSYIQTGFATKVYRTPEGHDVIGLIISLIENGEMLRVVAPRLYVYQDGPNKTAVFQACLMICYQTKMVQFEYDATDGEIRATVDLPLEDAELTKRQLMRCIGAVCSIVDDFDGVIRRAMDDGVVEFPDREDPQELMRAFAEFMRERAKARDAAGGELEE